MGFFNATNWVGTAIEASVQNGTGDIFLSLLLILIGLMMLAFMFNIPMEWVAIFFVPINIGLMSEYHVFMAPGGALLIYLALLLVKNLPWK